MNFPDIISTEFSDCPMCNTRLHLNKFAACKRYYCSSDNTRVGVTTFPHYEFIRFIDNSIYMQYIIKPFQIMVNLNGSDETSIFELKEVNNAYYDYTSKLLTIRETSAYLTMDNLDAIKKKIRMLTMFT